MSSHREFHLNLCNMALEIEVSKSSISVLITNRSQGQIKSIFVLLSFHLSLFSCFY